MTILLLLFSFLVLAEENDSEKYCFSTAEEGLTAKHKFKAVQIPSDQVTQDENCLIIQMRPHRREIIQRYILSSFPHASISFSSASITREPCLLKVEKEKINKSTNLSVINQQLSAQKEQGATTEVMQIQTLKEFAFTVDQDEIKGSCRFINSNRYEISIEVRKNAKLPIAGNLPPPDQETMTLQTVLQLTRGEKIELGSIVRNLKHKDGQIDLTPKIEIGSMNQQETEKVFLSFQ